MKNIEEFYKEIMGSAELQNELKSTSDEMLAAFLKKHGCDADVKDFTEFVRSQNEGELKDDDATAAAGGAPQFYKPRDPKTPPPFLA